MNQSVKSCNLLLMPKRAFEYDVVELMARQKLSTYGNIIRQFRLDEEEVIDTYSRIAKSAYQKMDEGCYRAEFAKSLFREMEEVEELVSKISDYLISSHQQDIIACISLCIVFSALNLLENVEKTEKKADATELMYEILEDFLDD